MAPATPQSSQPESMEDILQSIKRIIEDDAGAKPKADSALAAGPGDVLDLTEMVKADGTITPIGPLPKPVPAAAPSGDVVTSIDAIFAKKPAETAPSPAAAAAPLPDGPFMDEPEPAGKPPAMPVPAVTMKPLKPVKMEDGLVSEEAAQAAAAALRPIAESAHKDYSIPHVSSPQLRNGNTVEDLILESLRPMLKAWLDEHLPTIVQRIVEKEVKRIVTFHQD